MTRTLLLLLSLVTLITLYIGQRALAAEKEGIGKEAASRVGEASDSTDHHSLHVHEAKGAWVAPTEEVYRDRLSSLQYRVLREQGTERAYSGEFWDDHRSGVYHCRACGLPLFDSKTKFESGTGWPSFWTAVDGSVERRPDSMFGMGRTELVCARCASHLGHVFQDGPAPTGERHCINSASLELLLREEPPAPAMREEVPAPASPEARGTQE